MAYLYSLILFIAGIATAVAAGEMISSTSSKKWGNLFLGLFFAIMANKLFVASFQLINVCVDVFMQCTLTPPTL